MVKLAIQYGAKLDNAKGVPDELLKKACSMAVCKVNTDSDLRISFTAGIRKYLSENPDTIDLRKYNEEGMQLVKSVVDHKLKNVFMSANKA